MEVEFTQDRSRGGEGKILASHLPDAGSSDLASLWMVLSLLAIRREQCSGQQSVQLLYPEDRSLSS